MKILANALGVTVLWAVLANPALSGGGNNRIQAYIDTLPIESVDATEEDWLLMMRQEEKLARDVYLVMDMLWGVPAFANIAQSEQSHMDLVKYVLDRYGIADPLTSDQLGVFPDARFAQLFTLLVNFGLRSPLHAEIVGAFIEDLDIVDLDQALAGTDNRDLDTLWQNLQRGSRNHMRAFYGLLDRQSFTYTGIYLPYWRILAIVTSPRENQPVDENGDPLP